MLEIRHADQRGRAEHGWLSTRHTFSFASYYDPEQSGFSDLLVINDDRIMPAQGFGKHPHRDMEIFTYVLEGSLEHKDTMGTGSVIVPGDIQVMSAGTGIAHSEFNHSTSVPVHLLQVWIATAMKGTPPRYQQRHFGEEQKRGVLRLVLSPDGANESLTLQQDTRVYAGLFDGDESAELELAGNRYAYVHVAHGAIAVNGIELGEGDGARIRGERTLRFTRGHGAEVLVFDLRGIETPKLWS
ncbi:MULTISPECIES: pirin family protein [Burkholderia]|jgi:quercetin 2,3-dioxygenase|uniref:Pirin family protein n=2 Tax=Burkholderia contaminans TaxID=488447 RepID=A0A1E3FSV1_9BURK|nr:MULTISPECIES: pirin family protein [Burkholderia]UTP25867.1 pirin family protein [Burkholderia sp. FXe9]KKL41325.1 quercetin 2,3-dioxygenase [Burkholderia contaminans LMG 23361]MBA9828595.1 pirin family protein [Burkholderia contaminans]MBA9840580.1 pirin family protein [Burkholderia contaminans]MBA9860315.1 pirin family protein [Burkholderia contaminans]